MHATCPVTRIRRRSRTGLKGKKKTAYKFPTRPLDIPQRQQHRRLRPLIHRLRPPITRHVRTHIPRTTAINQHPTPLPLLLPRDRPRHARDAALADSISGAGPAPLILDPALDGLDEGFHEPRDVVDRLGVGERGADLGRVFGREVAGHAGDVDEAAAGTDQREEGARGGQGAVVIAPERLPDDIDVWIAIMLESRIREQGE